MKNFKEISTNSNTSKKAIFLEQLFYVKNNRKPESRDELADFIKEERIIYKKLLKKYQKKGGEYDMIGLLVENWKEIGLEKIPYEKYNAIFQDFQSVERTDFEDFYNLLGEEKNKETNAKHQDNRLVHT